MDTIQFTKQEQGFTIENNDQLLFSGAGSVAAKAVPEDWNNDFRVQVYLNHSRVTTFDSRFYPARQNIIINSVNVTSLTRREICDKLRDEVFGDLTGVPDEITNLDTYTGVGLYSHIHGYVDLTETAVTTEKQFDKIELPLFGAADSEVTVRIYTGNVDLDNTSNPVGQLDFAGAEVVDNPDFPLVQEIHYAAGTFNQASNLLHTINLQDDQSLPPGKGVYVFAAVNAGGKLKINWSLTKPAFKDLFTTTVPFPFVGKWVYRQLQNQPITVK